MADIRKNIACAYCGAHFHIKFSDEFTPEFCCFCGEAYEDVEEEIEDEEDDGDLDYSDDERDIDHI